MKRKLVCSKCNSEQEVTCLFIYKIIFNNTNFWKCDSCQFLNENIVKDELLTLFAVFLIPIFLISPFFAKEFFYVFFVWMLFLVTLMPIFFAYNVSSKLRLKNKKIFGLSWSLFLPLIIISKQNAELDNLRQAIKNLLSFNNRNFLDSLTLYGSFLFIAFFVVKFLKHKNYEE